MQVRNGDAARGRRPYAGTLRRIAGSLRMRLLPALPLLLLAACDQGDSGKPGMSTNIVEEQSSYDVSNLTPAQDESLRPGNATAPPGNETAPARPREQQEASAPGTIPAALRGHWTGVNDACGDRSSDLELTVTPKSLIFHESVGTVTDVAPGPDGRVRVTASFTGEGDSWTRKVELRPSANGRELTMINDGAAVTRKRC